METLNSTNMRERERELATSFENFFRRVWLQKTRFNNVCITVFPLGNGSYTMYFAKNLQDWSLESLRNVVLSQIEKNS